MKQVTESDRNGTVGGRGMHWTFASEALVWIPEQWLKAHAAESVPARIPDQKMREKKKQIDIDYMNKTPQIKHICISQNTT